MEKKALWLILFFTAGTVFAQAPDMYDSFCSLFPQADFETLKEKERIQTHRYYADDMTPQFLPNGITGSKINACWTRDTGLIIESLYLYKKKSNKGALVIPVILRSISHLKGIQYYSHSRKKMRTLYESAYVIDSPETKTRLPDPPVLESPQTVFTVQTDLTFSENMYEYTFFDSDQGSGFCTENITPLKKSIIKMVDPRCLNVGLAVYDFDDYIVLYGIARADVGYHPLFKNKMINSISARSDALYEWFIKEYERYGEKK